MLENEEEKTQEFFGESAKYLKPLLRVWLKNEKAICTKYAPTFSPSDSLRTVQLLLTQHWSFHSLRNLGGVGAHARGVGAHAHGVGVHV